MVLPEMNDPTFENLPINFYGVCTDYILKTKIKLINNMSGIGTRKQL